MFKEGKKGLDDYAAAAKRLGIVIEEDILRKAEVANDQIEDMGKVFAKTGTVLALEFMPILQDLAKLLTDPAFLQSLKNIIKQFKGIVTFGGFAVEQMSLTLSGLKNIVDPGEIAKITSELSRLRKEAGLFFEQLEAAKRGVIGAAIPSVEEAEARIRNNIEKRIALQKKLNALIAGSVAKIPEKAVISVTKTPPRPSKKTKPDEQIGGVFAPLAASIDDAALERIEVDLARALEKAQGRFRVFGNQTKLAEERLAAFERAMDSLIEAGALERSPELIEKLRIQIDVLRFSLGKTGEKTEEVFGGMTREAEILERVFEGVFDSIDKALDSTVEGVLLGTRSMSSAFADLAQNVGLAIQKMIIDIAVLDPLRKGIKDAGGIQGLASLATNFISGLFGAPSIAALPLAPPSALGLPGVSVPTAAHGGVFMAPTLRVIGEEGPEAVIPLDKLKGGSDSDVNITIINNTSSRVEASQRQGPGGLKDILVLVNESVSKDIRNGGSVANAITQTFGSNRQGAIR